MADWTSLRYAVADVEGNGQQPPDLVELAVLPITDGIIGEPVSWLVKPPRPITSFATGIHGISGKDVASAPSLPTSSTRCDGRWRTGCSSPTTRMWT